MIQEHTRPLGRRTRWENAQHEVEWQLVCEALLRVHSVQFSICPDARDRKMVRPNKQWENCLFVSFPPSVGCVFSDTRVAGAGLPRLESSGFPGHPRERFRRDTPVASGVACGV